MSSDRISVARTTPEPRADTAWTGPSRRPTAPAIPAYLQDTYWWAYLDERTLRFFEQEWVVNLILWGNMRRLTDALLEETRLAPRSRVLQLACVYGSFSRRLAQRLAQSGSSLDLVDVAPIQLANARRKLEPFHHVRLRHEDSSKLDSHDGVFDQTVLFFLLHEQPEDVRRATLAEAFRVTKPGGRIVIVDYHRPRRWNPMRYLMWPVLHFLEPFALDLWRKPLESWFPPQLRPDEMRKREFFGGLYQQVVITR